MRYSEFKEYLTLNQIPFREDEEKLKVTYHVEISKIEEHSIRFVTKVINFPYEYDLLKRIIELAETPLDEREDEKSFIFPLPGLITTDGKQQYLSYKDGYYFASRLYETLKQRWKEEHLELIPEQYRQFAEEFHEGEELEDDYKK